MPSRCSAPGCRSNYDDDERIPVFKMLHKPDELRHAWIRALHRDDIHELKTVLISTYFYHLFLFLMFGHIGIRIL